MALVYVEIKNWALGKIPSTKELQNAWSEWEVRCLVVLSLTLQLLLIVSADVRQKYKGRRLPYVAAFVWSVYQLADWVAIVAMTTILRGSFEKENAVVVLWTPFLLWHLGSPANITAYSLEDNELWLRHFLGLVSNGAEAVYIYLRFRTASAPNFRSLHYIDFMVVPLLIGRILKYAERIVALRCASNKQLQIALYSEAVRNFRTYKKTGMTRTSKRKGMIRRGLYELPETDKVYVEAKDLAPEVKFLQEAYASFEIFIPLFLSFPFQISKEYHQDMVFMKKKSAVEAFQLVNIELQFLYDLFFTKNPIQQRYHKVSRILRGFYVLSALSVLIAFSTMKNIGESERDHIPRVDVAVTYLLLSGAIFLDVYASALHLWSNWTMIRFGIAGGKLLNFYYWLVASRLRSIKSKRGRPKTAQYDLLKEIASPLTRDSIFTPVINLIDSDELRKKFEQISWVEVGDDLMEFIYGHLIREREECESKGPIFTSVDFPRLVQNCLLKRGLNSKDWEQITEQDFTNTVFVLHIATMLVYNCDLQRGQLTSVSYRISTTLSGYMLYLLLVHPSMLPKEFDVTALESFLPDKDKASMIKKKNSQLLQPFRKKLKWMDLMHKKDDPTQTTQQLAARIMDFPPSEVMWNKETREPKKALNIAHLFQSLVTEARWDDEEKWELLADLWVKIMIRAASHCSWKEHALRLRHGGELLTHVSLLMAHLGLSKDIHVREEVDDGDDSEGLPSLDDIMAA